MQKGKKRLKETINNLSKYVNITDVQEKTLLDKYSTMTDKEIIKDLFIKIYHMIGPNSIYYEQALYIVQNYNKSICPSIEIIKTKLEKMFSNEVEGNMSLEENHKLIKSTLIEMCKLFNQHQIDYYIIGALPCFLKTNQTLFRYHDDIDIMINEDDIPKVKNILEGTIYQFKDDRFPNIQRYYEMLENKPPHLLLAQNKNNEFHLGFFCFVRNTDNSITIREYSHRLENGEILVDVLERHYNTLGTQLRYDENPTIYNGISFRTGTIEYVYHLKSYTKRPKDITDIKKLEPYVDINKLELLKENQQEERIILNVDFPPQEGVKKL